MIKKSVAVLSLFATGLAFALTWGPFYVAALGRDYVTTSFALDKEVEFDAAQKLASLYLAKSLNTPAAIAKAIKDDYMRVVYADGQIADFKIKRWPSSIPLDFDTLLSRANQQDLSPEARFVARHSCPGASGRNVRTASFNTGYWGISYPSSSDGSTVIVEATWISTGTVVFTYFSFDNLAHPCP